MREEPPQNPTANSLGVQYQAFLAVSESITAHRDLAALFRDLVLRLQAVVRFDFVTLILHDPARNVMRRHILASAQPRVIQVGRELPVEDSPGGWVWQTQQPLLSRDVTRDTRFPQVLASLRADGVQACCWLPLTTAQRRLGAISFGSKHEGTYSDADVEFMQRVLQQVEVVAPTDSVVLIQGETGTGKELIARGLHNLSGRRDRPFVKLNCAAIPTGLLESELFGHARGAFTGAIAQKIGRFELAHRGTLLLDEVGDIPLELQPKLLRVLQEQEFERLGSTRTIQVSVRLIAATNRDLAQMVAAKQFRSDLYYRFNVFPLTLPPLRERADDIPLLVRYFAQKYARRLHKQIELIPTETMAALARYHWPGNIRELQNVIERAVILSRGLTLQVPLSELRPPAETVGGNGTTLEAADREHILRALQEAHWVVGGPAGAATRLGMRRTTLQSKLRKLGITRPR